VAARDRMIGHGGVMPGRELAFVFSTLRGNDLIWPYVVGNYLEGRQPDAFDILYWNADSTNLPGPMYCWYVRNTYLENNLRIPGKTTQCEAPVDFMQIDVPTYVLASREDHIVPWQTAYSTTGLVSGDVRFTLAASGHIAGVINPASRNKRNFWIDGELGKRPEQWLETAREVPGSWWTDWSAWLRTQSGEQIPARTTVGNAEFSEIEPAPGRYVTSRPD
jgi:poly[(R)-3-hydroxyalkanoate] polymerase subunit PhaC